MKIDRKQSLRRREKTTADSRRGATLVEIMIASLVLALLAIAGGMYLSHARYGIAKERNRRVALESVNSRIEELRSIGYLGLLPLSNTVEATTLNRVSNLRRTTTLSFFDLDGTGATTDAIRVLVASEYMRENTNTVRMEAVITK